MASLGPFRRLFHWGPICVLVIIKLITWCMMHFLNMYWPPHMSLGGAVHAGVFLFFSGATLFFFMQSLLEGPGFVPIGWKPEKDEDCEHLQYCLVCQGYKAPRSHHCRKCGRCVMKMDHHCPWINGCVGHSNHTSFVLFITCAVIGCAQACTVLTICMYHALSLPHYVRSGALAHSPRITLSLTSLVVSLLAIGISVGVVLAVGALLYLQLRSILRNRTTIEDWIVEKAASRREEEQLPVFRFPYDLGWKGNVRALLWDKGDGLSWALKEGSGPYDLTCEQKAQKAEKRLRSRLYTAIACYSGAWFPLLAFFKAAWTAPCSDEPRIALLPGDIIRATRQRRHWLFGEKLLLDKGDGVRGPRGWFPQQAALPTDQMQRRKRD